MQRREQGLAARAGAAENVLEELGGLKRGTLRVVASQTIAACWLPPVLSAFHERYPTIGIELAIGEDRRLLVRAEPFEKTCIDTTRLCAIRP